MRERRPWRRDAGALGLGRRRLRLRAADRGHGAFAAGDALSRLMQIADWAFASDWPVIEVRRLDPEPSCKLLLGIAIAPAQEIDDVERADLAEQFGSRVMFRALERLLQQRQRLEPIGDFLGPVDDLADADDNGDAVFGLRGNWHFSSFHFYLSRHSGAMRSIEPGISRFRVWSFGPS